MSKLHRGEKTGREHWEPRGEDREGALGAEGRRLGGSIRGRGEESGREHYWPRLEGALSAEGEKTGREYWELNKLELFMFGLALCLILHRLVGRPNATSCSLPTR